MFQMEEVLDVDVFSIPSLKLTASLHLKMDGLSLCGLPSASMLLQGLSNST